MLFQGILEFLLCWFFDCGGYWFVKKDKTKKIKKTDHTELFWVLGIKI